MVHLKLTIMKFLSFNWIPFLEVSVRVARIIGVDSSIKNSALQKINFAFYTQITNNSLPTPIISRLQLFLPLVYKHCNGRVSCLTLLILVLSLMIDSLRLTQDVAYVHVMIYKLPLFDYDSHNSFIVKHGGRKI